MIATVGIAIPVPRLHVRRFLWAETPADSLSADKRNSSAPPRLTAAIPSQSGTTEWYNGQSATRTAV
jgi:hypothetical protein